MLHRFTFGQMHMGTYVRTVLYAAAEASAARAAAAAFRRIAALEKVMSDYDPESELMGLCRRAGGPPVPVSEELFAVLQRAQEMARRTNGAFDVTVGPYSALWREAVETSSLPSGAARQEAASRTGWEKMRLDPEKRTAELARPDMRLDLGGIAKGYILDQALQTLRQCGAGRALIDAGGDVVAGSPPPDRDGWRIAIEQAEPGERIKTIAHAAVASSSDGRQFMEFADTRYSHIIDPRSGLGLTGRTAVTVQAPDSLTADSWATALSVLGPEGPSPAGSIPNISAYVRPLHTV